MKAKFTTDNQYSKITMTEVVQFLNEHASAEEKKEFKEWAYTTKDGKPSADVNWLNAKNRFLAKYAPELLPQKKVTLEELIRDW